MEEQKTIKLQKALKVKNGLINEITKIKSNISSKNSYIVGSINSENADLKGLYSDLNTKINELITLKYMINEANQDIQTKIYLIGEYKALITFWNGVSVTEGAKILGFEKNILTYNVHFTEKERDDIVMELQTRVDAIQEEIDTHNHNTEIPWG